MTDIFKTFHLGLNFEFNEGITLRFSKLHLDFLDFKDQVRIQGGGRNAAPPKFGKNMIFWRKIVIFHMNYPKYFRASLRSAHFF